MKIRQIFYLPSVILLIPKLVILFLEITINKKENFPRFPCPFVNVMHIPILLRSNWETNLIKSFYNENLFNLPVISNHFIFQNILCKY